MSVSEFPFPSLENMIAEVDRENKMREHVYAKKVGAHSMSRNTAAYQKHVMHSIGAVLRMIESTPELRQQIRGLITRHHGGGA